MALPTAQRLILFLSFIAFCLLVCKLSLTHAKTETTRRSQGKDLRWPNNQFVVLVDRKSINETERQILEAVFDQLEHRTCLKVKRLDANSVNPFDTRQLSEDERNFVYIFRGRFGLASHVSHNQATTLGLSTFGCLNQGRQSMVLTDLAFRWPELVLKYHVLRSLAVQNPKAKPDIEEALRVLNKELPLSQKIEQQGSRAHYSAGPTYFAYSTSAVAGDAKQAGKEPANYEKARVKLVQFLDERDLGRVKELYNCSDFQNRLSPKPLSEPQHPLPDSLQPTANNSKVTGDLPSKESSASAITEAPTMPETTRKPDDSQRHKHEPADDGFQPTLTTGDLSGNEEMMNSNDSAGASESKGRRLDDPLIDDAAQSIANQLLSEQQDLPTTPPLQIDQAGCRPSDMFCPAPSSESSFLTTTTTTTTTAPLGEEEGQQPAGGLRAASNESAREPKHERPMMLKLDEFHAQDPHLQQANQMKLIQVNNDSLASYRLMDPTQNNVWPQSFMANTSGQQLDQGSFPIPGISGPKTEVFISFETNPLAAAAGSQVLKLCSCTCQTMTPAAQTVTPTLKPPFTEPMTDRPTFEPTDLPASTTELPSTKSTRKPTTTGTPETTPEPPTTTATTTTTTTTPRPITKPTAATTTELPITEKPVTPPPFSTTTATAPETETETESPTPPTNGSLTDNACDQVQWVKPSKSVYSSAKIVWDVDRGNQNYFICSNLLNGELVPGKTHGFSCKVSEQGKAYELHNFNVLTKPESVNLAWVQRTSDSLGKTNLPVIGGHSKEKDPYAVARCLVRDENNDVITLIGHVNSQGNGWFPFDDIQIECAQYDILACVSG